MDPKMGQSLELHLLSPFSIFFPAVFLVFFLFLFLFVCLFVRQKQFFVRVFYCGIAIPSLHCMTCLSTGGGLTTSLSPLVRILSKVLPFDSWKALTSKVFCTFYKVPPPTLRGCMFPFILLALRAYLISIPLTAYTRSWLTFVLPLSSNTQMLPLSPECWD